MLLLLEVDVPEYVAISLFLMTLLKLKLLKVLDMVNVLVKENMGNAVR